MPAADASPSRYDVRPPDNAPAVAQHRDPLSGHATAPPRPITPGPIAVLPEAHALFVTAVQRAGGEVAPLSADTRGLLWLSAGRADELDQILTDYPSIEWVQLPWAGVDAFRDVLRAHADGPVFTSAKGAYAEPVAEHALALAHATLREFAPKARAARWAQQRTGRSLYGLAVTIVGAGGIAAELLRLLAPWRCEVTVVRRSADPLPGATRTVPVAELDAVLPTTDVLILAAASTEGTRHLMDARRLALLPHNAVLVNIARGPLVDTDALTEALASGNLLGAGLDVTDPEPLPDDHPLFAEPRCLITSHSADTAEMTAPLLAGRVDENVRGFLAGTGLVGIVDPRAGY
ncbi:NAD(P)-dependent oxidoreductase [Microcella sp.]|uniref:NAD(P)-dependent oxidoreductase n=1 Tax=Microcella sp. TaxID=1913979 RepID=UPI00391A2F68